MDGPGLTLVLVGHFATGVEWAGWLFSVASTSLPPCADSVAYRGAAGKEDTLCHKYSWAIQVLKGGDLRQAQSPLARVRAALW